MKSRRGIAWMSALVLIAGVPGRGWAQQGPGETEGSGARHAMFQLSGGIALPLSHLSGTSGAQDLYATPGVTLAVRFFYPVTSSLDFMADLSLPRFAMDETAYERGTNREVSESSYRANALSMGARWTPYHADFGDIFVLATGGMYHLVFDGFIRGLQVTDRGAYRLGGSVGGGVKVGTTLTDFEFVIRYHRFTDTGTFGLGDLAWLEFGLAVDLEVGRDR